MTKQEAAHEIHGLFDRIKELVSHIANYDVETNSTIPKGPNVADKTVNQQELYAGEKQFGDNGVVQRWRVVGRDSSGGGRFDATGSPADPGGRADQGTSNQQWLTRWMSGHPDIESGFPPTFPTNGRAEVEILTSKGWLNARTGEPTDVPEGTL